MLCHSFSYHSDTGGKTGLRKVRCVVSILNFSRSSSRDNLIIQSRETSDIGLY